MDSRKLGTWQARNIPVLDIHELAAGKLSALFSRHQARDLFDVHHLLLHKNIDQDRLRVAFLVYGACNRKDWRTILLSDITFDKREIDRMILPVLQNNAISTSKDKARFTKSLVGECQKRLSIILPFTQKETEFLNNILDEGNILPDLITSDPVLQDRIGRHPMLQWKADNVRRHFNIPM